MNTPAFRLAGISDQVGDHVRRAHRLVPQFGMSPLLAKIVAGGSVAVLAIVVAGVMIGSDPTPDPTQTAAVPHPQLPQTTGTKASVSVAKPAPAPSPAPTVSSGTAAAGEQPDPTRLAAAPVSAVTARFESLDAAATTGPDERGSSAVEPLLETKPIQPPEATAAAPEGLRGSIDVEVAETEAEVAMLEQTTGMIDTQATDNPADGPLPDLQPAKVVKYANLRDGPADEAKVIAVVPANAAIEAETGCNWCTVVYKDQRGYMYKSLIRRSVAEEAKAGQGLF
ncbi:SH3 domain-containing protein [Mesorhizobium sp. CC13]|uniref:SH3 domain-containing protein n=1 Tax=Mesorhizobium sp. CC13 TaxID=3029194 RepID=UPI00326659C3